MTPAAGRFPRTVQPPVSPEDSMTWGTPVRYAQASKRPVAHKWPSSINYSNGPSSKIKPSDPIVPHTPGIREWPTIELEPFRAQFDEWYIDKGKTLAEIQQLFSPCGFNVR